jgi:hypothetical protein
MAVAGRGFDPFVPFLPLRAREASMTQAEWLAELAAVVTPRMAELRTFAWSPCAQSNCMRRSKCCWSRVAAGSGTVWLRRATRRNIATLRSLKVDPLALSAVRIT